jgi:transcriptional regulator with XRE-family HTH domain
MKPTERRNEGQARLRLVVSNEVCEGVDFTSTQRELCKASSFNAASPRGEAVRPCSMSLTEEPAMPIASPMAASVIPLRRRALMRDLNVFIARTVRHPVKASQRHSVTEFRENISMRPRDLPDFDHIGLRIRWWREHRKLTLARLAKKSGLSAGAISDLEKRRQSSTGKLVQLAHALEINPNYLATDKGDPLDLDAAPPAVDVGWPFSFDRLVFEDLDTNERELAELKFQRVIEEIKSKRPGRRIKKTA